MKSEPTRSYQIDNKKISIYDNLITRKEAHDLDFAFRNAAFTKNEIARPDKEEYRHWALNLSDKEFKSTPLYEKTLVAVNEFKEAEENYRPYRQYCNYASYGDMLFTHTDSLPENKELTALWYICSKWDPEWGGETIFYNSNNDAEYLAMPVPGRLVLFDGRIKHTGRAPNRICYQPRFTFAVKLEQY